ncbi:MAG TPA: type II toxin-antitoxin system antitoxin SocA domain-containing protein [Longimicrobium sp.]|nr:type II toxin-antitoxin system antitoxin SocA domain-containing protein [Longimicrobium sp.]
MLPARSVARYFLAKVDEDAGDSISNLKLQKLVYYAQAYHLAMYGEPLIPERVEAWEHGPVVPDLYRSYKQHGAEPIPAPDDFDAGEYDPRTRDLLDEIFEVFGQYSAAKLRNLTHAERPWITAYANGARDRVISHAAMREFYKDFVTE